MCLRLFGITGLLLLLSCSLNAQRSQSLRKKEVYRYYESKEKAGSKKNSVLVFFTDNTFINYGLSGESAWYTSGRWLGNKEMFMCRTYTEIADTVQLVKEIRELYLPKLSTFTIGETVPFVKITYLNYVFEIQNNSVYDKIKKLHYYASVGFANK